MSTSTDISKAAELLLENFYTVKVVFANSNNEYIHTSKHYTYKVHRSMQLAVNDFVLVRANSEVKLVQVVAVDSEADIDYGANFKYNWAFQKVELNRLEQLEELDRRVKKSVETLRRRQMKRDLLKELTGEIGEDELKQLTQGLDLPGITVDQG